MAIGKFKIRKATTKDIRIISSLSSNTFIETYEGSVNKKYLKNYTGKNFNKKILLNEFNNKQITYLLATFNEKAIGYSKLNMHKNSIEVERIYLLKRFINHGIGTIFMNKITEISKNNKIKYIWLQVWEGNILAINFYKKFGFKPFGSTIFKIGKIKQKDLLFKKYL